MIYQFTANYIFLSNFYKTDIIYNDLKYSSSEHAFQHQKNLIDDDYRELCLSNAHPAIIKKESKNVKLIDDWDNKKLHIMKEIIKIKFSNKELKSLLIKTGNSNIQEGNFHGDKFWGVCLKFSPNIGENHLGRILMEVREFYKKEIQLF
jgi:ribA/ribD-fused uncharacterized protein